MPVQMLAKSGLLSNRSQCHCHESGVDTLTGTACKIGHINCKINTGFTKNANDNTVKLNNRVRKTAATNLHTQWPDKNYAHTHAHSQTHTPTHMAETIQTVCSAITPKSCDTTHVDAVTFRIWTLGNNNKKARIKCVQYIHTTHGDLWICELANGRAVSESVLLAIRVDTNWCQQWLAQTLLYWSLGRRQRQQPLTTLGCVCMRIYLYERCVNHHAHKHSHTQTRNGDSRVVRVRLKHRCLFDITLGSRLRVSFVSAATIRLRSKARAEGFTCVIVLTCFMWSDATFPVRLCGSNLRKSTEPEQQNCV